MTVMFGVSLVAAALALLLWRVLLRLSLALAVSALCVPVTALTGAILSTASRF
jgi:hypothetical protein